MNLESRVLGTPGVANHPLDKDKPGHLSAIHRRLSAIHLPLQILCWVLKRSKLRRKSEPYGNCTFMNRRDWAEEGEVSDLEID